MNTNAERGSGSLVAISQIPSCSYARRTGRDDDISAALSRVAAHLQWSDGRGPFGALIPRGARVLIKPNLVLHSNLGTGGLEPLVTHGSLISAVVEAALLADASEVVVGDAPLQSCDFSNLLASTGLDAWADETMKRHSRFKGIRDFRRTTCAVVHGIRKAEEDRQPEDRFTLFDLGRDSLLEPISNEEERFRVTWYDPRLMARTHRPGHHQFLVAREVLEADLVINLPKLKTHKKAGVTCALKNLIGINGNKEYLPHHRLGGSETGGDCYPGASKVKRAREYVMDRQNLTSSIAAGMWWHGLDALFSRMSGLQGDRIGVEGSWSGNDTIWRTCLDLNRILLYGELDGSMADQRQRRVIHVVDAVIAGQGDGPLSPDPLPLGLILAGDNAVAVDWVAAHFLAYDPFKIPLLRHAFGDFRWPLCQFSNAEVRVTGDLGQGSPAILADQKIPVAHPPGWRDASAQTATIETHEVAGSHVRHERKLSNNDVSDG
jgi:uncharacterized protein (DUF362 family)